MDSEAARDGQRFDPRVAEPAAEPSLIPVIRPSAAGRPPSPPPAPAEAPAEPGTEAPGEGDTPAPTADAPLTEPPRSEPVPTSVLAPAEPETAPETSVQDVVPDAIIPEPLLEHGPAAPGRRRRRGRRNHHRAVFEETLPTQALVMVDRLQASPYGRRIRSTLRQRPEPAREALEARTTLDFALKLGETMFSFGASSLDVETSIIVVTQAYGIHETEVDLTNQAISLNYAPDSSRGEVPYTLQRVVRSNSTNFQGLAAVHRLVEQISEGAVERQEAQRRLVEIRHRPKPYPPAFEVLFAGVFVACFVPFIGGTWAGAALGMVSTWLVFWLATRLVAARVPELYATGAGAFVATMIAFGASAAHLPVNPGIVVAGGIMMLLPTSRFVTAVQDAINGFPVTAAGRFISALLVFFGIMGGIMVGVAVWDLLGFSRLDLTSTSSVAYPTAVLAGLVAVAAACDVVVERAPWRLMVGCAAVSTLAFLALAGVQALGLTAPLAPALAAVVIGLLARPVALRLGAPPLVVALPSLLFLLPGLSIFRGLYEFTVESASTATGLLGIVSALVTIAGIGAGTVLGDTLARPFTGRPAEDDGPAVNAPTMEGHQR